MDPTKWPLDGLELVGSQEAHLRIAGWIRATQPALNALAMRYFDQPQLLVTLSSIGARTALTELSLSGEAADILESLVPVCLFSKLKRLSLACRYPPEDDFEGRLDLAALQPLSALEHLRCCSWPLGEFRGGRLLPKLTFLYFNNGGSWSLDAALPSLQVLWFDCASIRLAGEHLQLPCLTALGLFYGSAAVQWPAMPQLAALTAGVGRITSLGSLSTLQQLTSVRLGCDMETTNRVLQAAPASVLHLNLDQHHEEDWQPPRSDTVPRLTKLSIGCGLSILTHLGPCCQLEELCVSCYSAADLIVEHLGWLCSLTSLRRVSFGRQLREGSGAGRLIQLVKKVLPANCTLDQSLTP